MNSPTVYLLFSRAKFSDVTSWGSSIVFGSDGVLRTNKETKEESIVDNPLCGFSLCAYSTNLSDLVENVKANPSATHKIIPVSTILDVKLDFSVKLGGITPSAVEKEFGE